MPGPAWFRKLFPRRPPVIGVVHLRSTHALDRIARLLDGARRDADAYLTGGVDGLIVENFGDAPFRKDRVAPHTIAVLARAAEVCRDLAGSRAVGVNVLRNDGQAAIGVAAAAGLDFVRINVLSGVAVTDQGLIEGDAAAVHDYRRAVAPRLRIFADVRVKHAEPLRRAPVGVEVEELVRRARADAVLVTGPATGSRPEPDLVESVRRAAGSCPVLVASGVRPDNLSAFPTADGFIVGSSLKKGGRTEARVDPRRVRQLVSQLRGG